MKEEDVEGKAVGEREGKGKEGKRQALKRKVYEELFHLSRLEPTPERGTQAVAVLLAADRLLERGLEELSRHLERSLADGAFFALYALANPRYPKLPPSSPPGYLRAKVTRLGEAAVRQGREHRHRAPRPEPGARGVPLLALCGEAGGRGASGCPFPLPGHGREGGLQAPGLAHGRRRGGGT